MKNGAATVFVVDDDASVRKALARLIQSVGLQTKTFASAQELLDQAPPEGPGCIVLDVRMPGLNGLELQAELTGRNIQTPIVFITGHGDIQMSVRAMKSGAVDFLIKPFNDKELLGAIKTAIEKDEYFKAAQTEHSEIQRRHQTLTPREREVLGLVVKGRMNKEIAAELGAAEKTVKVHRARVMQKMQVQSVAELVRAAERVASLGS